jgi:pimeloyl-ACP methyl ester carboxylesterase
LHLHSYASLRLVRTLLVSGALSATTTAGAWLTGTGHHQAFAGVPGAASWKAAVAAVAPGAAAPDLGAPAQVARFFAGLTTAQRLALARRDPQTVGNLDGVPYELRYTANEIASGRRTPGRLLGYDPRGSGHIIEVFGDLATADRIAVLVPGVDWSLASTLRRTGAAKANPVTGGQALRARMASLAPGTRTAVVVWLGYDPPMTIGRDAARSDLAIEGAPLLTRFVRDLPGTAKITLIGHSYGSVVVGRAAAGLPARVTDLVAVASPGLDADTVDGLRTRARVWAARTEDDLIGLAPHVRIAGYGHSTDPVNPDFGARVFRTGSAQGHGDYYKTGTESLENLARIVLADDASVTLTGNS